MFDLFVIQSILRVLPLTCEAQGFKIGLELLFISHSEVAIELVVRSWRQNTE